MTTKPSHASAYPPDFVGSVRATCLYIATRLGDLSDETVVVGGLVPSLLIEQERMVTTEDRHVGTLDLDLGLALAILDDRRYTSLTERLRAADFTPDTNERGNRTRQRWAVNGPPRVTVDFLIQPSLPADQGGTIRNIEPDFAALIAPGLRFAFVDRVKKTLQGQTIRGERATRDVWVAGPAAFVVLKALALSSRGEPKDAYDLFYVLRHFEEGLGDIAGRFGTFGNEPEAEQALRILETDYATVDSLGPRRTAEFILGAPDDDAQADIRSLVLDFVAACRRG
jgi:hypothetical protein